MNLRNCFVVWVFGLAVLPLMADQITMKNGDRVTGAIVKKDAATLTIKTELFGVVTLPWDKVESVKVETPVNVVTADGKTVKGTIATDAGKLTVLSGEAKAVVAPAEIVALRNDAEQKAFERLQNPGWLQLWAGNALIGFAGTKGNAETQTFTVGVGAARVTRQDTTKIYFNAIRASAFANSVSSQTAQAVRGGVAYNRNFGKKMFVNTFNDYEYDRFQNLDLRVVLGGGLGYNAWKGEKGKLDVLGGFAWNREQFGPPAPALAFTRNSTEAYWGDDFAYKLNARTSMYQNFRMFNNLSNGGQYRLNFDTGANTQLFKWLTWNLSLSSRYLSNPVAGRKNNDFLYTTGFGIAFAR
jgi:putative salt-induced outer membrane protein YdiY